MQFGSLNNLNNLNLIGGGGSVPWTPRSVPGLTSWYRAGSNTYMDGAIQFTSTDKAYLTIADNATISATTVLEIGVWVYLDSVGANRIIVNKGTDIATAANLEYALYYSHSGTNFKFSVSNGSTITTVTDNGTAPSTATWYFIRCGLKSDQTLFIQRNGGTEVTSASCPNIQDSTNAFNVGYDSASGTYMNGRLDSMYVTKTISSSAEVTALYNAGVGRMYSDLTSANGLGTFATNLISWWGFNEESGIRYDAKDSNHLSQAFIEMVTNGTFTGNSTGWTEGAGWAYGTNNEVGTATSGDLSQSTVVPTASHKYAISYTISTATLGSLYFSLGGVNGTTRSTAETFTEYITATSTAALAIKTSSAFTGIIDTITVRATQIFSSAGIADGLAIDGNLCASSTGTQYLYAGDNVKLQCGNGSTDFEIGGWVNFNALPSIGYAGIIGKESGGASSQCEWNLYLTSGLVVAQVGDGSSTLKEIAHSTSILTNNWYFVRMWIDSAQQKLFINVNEGTEASVSISGYTIQTLATDMELFRLGRYAPSIANSRMDGWYITKRLTTASERLALYNNGKGVKYADAPSTLKSESSLVWYNLDAYSAGTSNVTRVDATSNGLNLTSVSNVPSAQGVNYFEGSVSKIIPIVGSYTLTQTTQSARFLYSANLKNGRGALVGDALTKALGNAADLYGTGNITLFFVYQPRTAGGGGFGRIIDNQKLRLFTGASTLYLDSDGSTTVSCGPNITLLNYYVVIITRTSAGVVNFYLNGTLAGTANQNSGTPASGTPTIIGNQSLTGGARGFDGSLFEIGHYNSVLNATQISQLNNYLRTYYAI